MRKLFFLVPFFFPAFLSGPVQAQKNEEEGKVNKVITGFFDGISALDVKLMGQYVTNDFLLLEGGDVWNMDTVAVYLNQLKTGSFNRTNRLNFIRTEIKGNTAWVAYHNAADMNINGKKRNVEWLESAVLVKDGTEWKIQLLHSTPLKPKTH
jgi:ketosteroid isomerase-like protein